MMDYKCIKCNYLMVKDREYYDADGVQQTEVEYVCAVTGKEVNIVSNRECKYFVTKRRK